MLALGREDRGSTTKGCWLLCSKAASLGSRQGCKVAQQIYIQGAALLQVGRPRKNTPNSKGKLLVGSGKAADVAQCVGKLQACCCNVGREREKPLKVENLMVRGPRAGSPSGKNLRFSLVRAHAEKPRGLLSRSRHQNDVVVVWLNAAWSQASHSGWRGNSMRFSFFFFLL